MFNILNNMFLHKNIKILNEKYKKYGISFKLNDNVIRIIENYPFCLNNNPNLKESLKQKYNIIFNQVDKWHIGSHNVALLHKKRIAFTPQKPLSTLAENLIMYINQIEEKKLRETIFQMLKQNWKFFYAPAAMRHHHNYPYGLFEHTVEVIQNALLIYNTHQNIELDKDLIIAGSLLHDIGKINCYDLSDEMIIITELGVFQGHIVNGIKIVSEHIKTKKLDQLIHIISSHHNFKEWGSPVAPQSNEAYIIFIADLLSAKLW